nr:MAG TPA: hypothetical protein [Caudoviricetes sp.]
MVQKYNIFTKNPNFLTINLIFIVKVFEYQSIIIFINKTFSQQQNNTDCCHNTDPVLLPQQTS